MTLKNRDQFVQRALGKKRPRLVLLAVLVVLGLVGAVQMASLSRCQNGNCPRSGSASKDSGAAHMTLTPGAGAHDVDPVAQVMVKADAGKLTDVRMVNEGGKSVEPVMTPDNTAWKPTVPLGYGRTYTLTVTGHGPTALRPHRSRRSPRCSHPTRPRFRSPPRRRPRCTRAAATASLRWWSPASTRRSPTGPPPNGG